MDLSRLPIFGSLPLLTLVYFTTSLQQVWSVRPYLVLFKDYVSMPLAISSDEKKPHGSSSSLLVDFPTAARLTVPLRSGNLLQHDRVRFL